MKYLEINLTTYIQNLHTETQKTLYRGLRETKITGER